MADLIHLLLRAQDFAELSSDDGLKIHFSKISLINF